MKNRGFTLFIAALLASLLTALGLSMFTIAQKELILSSLGRDSQYAFYAADSGAECAMYWDFHHDAFNDSTVFSGSPKCSNKNLADFPTNQGDGTPDGVNGLGGRSSSSFWFSVDGFCSYVTVIKSNTAPHTTIESLGYNTGCGDHDNPRRLERAVRATF